MLKLFRSKFFIISLIIVLLLTAVSVFLDLSGRITIISDVMNMILYPFQKFGEILQHSTKGFVAYFTEFNNLKEENKRLKEELAAIQKDIETANHAKEESERLYEYYNLKRNHIDFELVYAEIVSYDADNFSSVLTLNRGSFHGIEKGLTVVYGENLVGFISDVEYMTSKVTLLLKPDVSIGAYNESTRKTGIITGDFTLGQEGQCKFTPTSTSKEVQISENDIIRTSGLGGIYPENLIIGKVTKVYPDAFEQKIKGDVQPLIDLYSIEHVMIIISFERKFE